MNVISRDFKPYFLRAIYEWLLDNDHKPYLLADATHPESDVPQDYVQDGKIVFNLTPLAINHFRMGNDGIEFQARFGGKPRNVFVPTAAVLGLYAYDTQQGVYETKDGMVFLSAGLTPPPSPPSETPPNTPKETNGKPKNKTKDKSFLKIVK